MTHAQALKAIKNIGVSKATGDELLASYCSVLAMAGVVNEKSLYDACVQNGITAERLWKGYKADPIWFCVTVVTEKPPIIAKYIKELGI